VPATSCRATATSYRATNNVLLVARNMLPRNMLRWCKRGLKAYTPYHGKKLLVNAWRYLRVVINKINDHWRQRKSAINSKMAYDETSFYM